MVVKQFRSRHFLKDFGEGASSDRVILPGPDKCRIKVTRFFAPAGFHGDDISYPVDETVYILAGKIWVLSVTDRSPEILEAGGFYHIAAGEIYALRVLQDSTLLCVFSAAPGGPLPDND